MNNKALTAANYIFNWLRDNEDYFTDYQGEDPLNDVYGGSMQAYVDRVLIAIILHFTEEVQTKGTVFSVINIGGMHEKDNILYENYNILKNKTIIGGYN